MSLSPSQKKIRAKELRIGLKAAKAVESYVKSNIAQKLTIRGKGSEEEKDILEATKVKTAKGEYRLLGLNITSNRYAFMHHFGFVGKRTEHIVINAKNTSFIRHSHPFKLKEKGLFDDVYEKSGAIKILVDGLSNTRTESITTDLKNMALELNKKDNG